MAIPKGVVYSNLKAVMEKRDLTIQDIKDKTTLSRTTISNLVHNKGNGIQFDTLRQLCDLLECKTQDLIIYTNVKTELEVTLFEEIDFSRELNEDGTIKMNFVINMNIELYIDDEKYSEKAGFLITVSVSEGEIVTATNLDVTGDLKKIPQKLASPIKEELRKSIEGKSYDMILDYVQLNYNEISKNVHSSLD